MPSIRYHIGSEFITATVKKKFNYIWVHTKLNGHLIRYDTHHQLNQIVLSCQQTSCETDKELNL